MQEQMDSGELDPFSMNEALPNLRNRDAAGVVGPHSGVPRAERAATAAGRVRYHYRYHYQAISAGHGVVSTSGCAGPVSQPLVTGMYQSVAHLDQVLSMLMCLVVVGLGPSLSFGFFFLPLLWTSFSCPKKNSVGSLISLSFMRLMSPSVCLSMYHPRTFFCKIMSVFGKSSDLSRVSAPC